MSGRRSVGILGAGRQALETAGYLEESGVAISFFFEEAAPGYPRDPADYDAPIVSSIDAARAASGGPVLAAVGHGEVRRRLVETWSDAEFTSVVSARAWLAADVLLAEGCTVAPLAAVNRCARIGRHVLINVGAIVSHDVVIGDYATLSPGCRIGGASSIGAGAFVGIGATVSDHVRIGDGALVAAGAVVVHDVEADTQVLGVPARPRRTLP